MGKVSDRFFYFVFLLLMENNLLIRKQEANTQLSINLDQEGQFCWSQGQFPWEQDNIKRFDDFDYRWRHMVWIIDLKVHFGFLLLLDNLSPHKESRGKYLIRHKFRLRSPIMVVPRTFTLITIQLKSCVNFEDKCRYLVVSGPVDIFKY